MLTEYEIKNLGTQDSSYKINSFVTTSGKRSKICVSQICKEAAGFVSIQGQYVMFGNITKPENDKVYVKISE